ncbi:IS701 family transposase [Pseudonocardia acidicola]|uniref:IS701 family transposase n=1 Tax=Pseudonocardia acidicola TaxID=2724939 RepID=A0ABX1SP34_9PSEU|nr:IS701 family transposase [Pseudonocardia acidicola]NMI02334.1 IS701 family transposase [Pseudonocardia acidicola]
MVDGLLDRVAGRFARVETRRRFAGLLRGMLAELPRKNCWTIAEHAGDTAPDGMQHLLNRAVWDTDGVAADLRRFVVEHLGEPGAVLVTDETGDLKKGCHTVGVQRQYTGTAGRIENAQIAVYLSYAARGGHTMIDRELYLPRSWTDDPGRCAAAGVPAEVEFATKPALAGAMITRAVSAGVPARWVAGDEVYGADPTLRAQIETLGLGYVLAIGCDRRVPTHGGPMRPDRIAAALPAHCWQRYSAGAGAKGPRIYDWALVTLTAADGSGHRWLLLRRHPGHGELAYYRCYSPHPVPLRELVRVAGARWTIEESFQVGKGLTGLDEHQVRRWISWRRWTLVAMLAHALLTVLAATERAQHPAPSGLIALTCNEIARLLNRLVIEPARRLADPLAWTDWRRRHQHRARSSHYKRRPET